MSSSSDVVIYDLGGQLMAKLGRAFCTDPRCDRRLPYLSKYESDLILQVFPISIAKGNKRILARSIVPTNGPFFVNSVPVYFERHFFDEIRLQVSAYPLSPKVIVAWICSSENRGYIVMEAAPKTTLQEIIQRGGIVNDEIIVEKLKCLHSKGIIHGDVHLSNIMVSDDMNEILFVDFGQATQSMDASNAELDLLMSELRYERGSIQYRHKSIEAKSNTRGSLGEELLEDGELCSLV